MSSQAVLPVILGRDPFHSQEPVDQIPEARILQMLHDVLFRLLQTPRPFQRGLHGQSLHRMVS